MPAVFQFRIWDQISGSHAIVTRWSTRDWIKSVGGIPIEDTRRVIDDRFIDSDGRVVIDPNGRACLVLISALQMSPKPHRVQGLPDIVATRELERLKFVENWAVGKDMVDCVVTDLGKAAVKQLVEGTQS